MGKILASTHLVFSTLLSYGIIHNIVNSSSCPSPAWTASPFGVCYYQDIKTRTWLAAVNNCVTIGGYLAHIHNASAQAFLKSFVAPSHGYNWIGLTDKGSEGTWKNVEGQTATFFAWATNPSQPDGSTRENCMSLDSSQLQKWLDRPCNESNTSICQDLSPSIVWTLMVNGSWSDWEWGACTVTCGGGTKTGTRTCSNPTPTNGGTNCTGNTTQTVACNVHECPDPCVYISGTPINNTIVADVDTQRFSKQENSSVFRIMDSIPSETLSFRIIGDVSCLDCLVSCSQNACCVHVVYFRKTSECFLMRVSDSRVDVN